MCNMKQAKQVQSVRYHAGSVIACWAGCFVRISTYKRAHGMYEACVQAFSEVEVCTSVRAVYTKCACRLFHRYEAWVQCNHLGLKVSRYLAWLE